MFVLTKPLASLIRLDIPVRKCGVVGVDKEVSVERTLGILYVVNPAHVTILARGRRSQGKNPAGWRFGYKLLQDVLRRRVEAAWKNDVTRNTGPASGIGQRLSR